MPFTWLCIFFYGLSTTQLLLSQCHAYMYEYIKINVDTDID